VCANLAFGSDALVTPHASFLNMASDTATRASAYRQWLSEGVSADDLASIRLHLQQELLTATGSFN